MELSQIHPKSFFFVEGRFSQAPKIADQYHHSQQESNKERKEADAMSLI
jgi:hypothetical protein